ncbi:substrate-binding domain-containing protein [Natronincola ferrireducens]|uniref:Monosaccharide ABC transporter substrate-binding protein, CUT2 family n=1 Tax=Natronincola ferrireducens TaxID=393762 RepID=A0A1G8XA26_9FIRM|nr:substrate-binding domain-containing protein [Natronincola ferrireducens]SDJ86715.1 monosaccharide ABC transporter substrate-binding protein, CUT2 family [Natronincola ferrireducens]
MKRGMSLLIIVILVMGLLTGCSGDAPQDASTENDTIRIGASLLTQSHPFQVAIKEAMEAEAAGLGVEIDIAIADQDLNRQISAIEDFINKGVDAIILVPVDSDGVMGAIMKAKEANIPVVTVDIKANGVEVDSHIATDNYAGGMIAAEAMAQFLEKAGDVGLITYPEVQSVRDRIDGFKEIADTYEDLNIVIELPGRTREEAVSASEDMLTSNPGLRGIFGFGDDMAIAATTVIGERNSDTIVVGFDGLEEARNSTDADNAFQAVVVQYPDLMGAEGVRNAVSLVRGEAVEKEVPVTPGLYVHGRGFVDVEVINGKVNIGL